MNLMSFLELPSGILSHIQNMIFNFKKVNSMDLRVYAISVLILIIPVTKEDEKQG